MWGLRERGKHKVVQLGTSKMVELLVCMNNAPGGMGLEMREEINCSF